ncbi:acyl-CoA synthetase (AMP-forming)/AMP-acid ligase II [Promicromonospora sp. AC04]|uniref:AMP-binding protein n=1 Tax=Promicromonospora sp. AC04 TaxID=2135723 RepID=UPI000D4E3A59|nr:acyl-CoA synthetase (AMP-forming)/AMP-acid ligase II [Promicromonospora sp. AC04]
MTSRVVVLRGSPDELVDRIRTVRARGDVPLIGDDRWPAAQWSAVHEVTEAGPVPAGAAWAALTSGTSGTPRVVLRTAASWERSFAAVSKLLTDRTASDELIMLPAPPSSSLTLFSLAHALGGGPRPVFPGGRAGAEATLFHGTPQALRTMLETRALPRLRTALVGGSHLDARLRADAESRGVRVVSYYGAAELSFVALDEGRGLREFPGVETAVRDGELWVRSPYTALGYLGRPGPLRTDEAWATVGDLATVDDGVLTLRGRGDQAILTASATVIPDEVEAGLRMLPGVADAIVFGIPKGRIGSLVAAMIEVETDAPPPTARRLRSMSATRLAPAHRPRVWFAGRLPRTASGKPARAEVRRLVASGEVTRLA